MSSVTTRIVCSTAVVADPEKRETVETARVLITVMEEAQRSRDYRFAYSEVMDAVGRRDHADLADLVQVMARLAVSLAALPTEVLLTLGPQNVPPELVERFGNPQAALQTAWLRVADFEAGE